MSLSLPAAWRKWLRGRTAAGRAPAQGRPAFRPGTDFVLEDRVLPATSLWSGLGNNANWSNPSNWVGGAAPGAGNDLIFPGGAKQAATSTNDFNNATFNSITLAASGYTLSGNALTLGAGGLTVNSAAPGGADVVNFQGLTLGANSSITETYAGETLVLLSSLTTSGFNLTVGGSGTVLGLGSASGGGVLTKAGPGTLVVQALTDFSGVTVGAGVVQLTSAGSLGSGAVTVNAGATLQLLGGTTLTQPVSLTGVGVGGGLPGSTVGALQVSGGATVSGPISLGGDAIIGVDVGGALNVTTNPIDLAGHVLTVNSGGTATLGTPLIGGAGSGLVVNSALTTGSVVLAAAGSYAGPTTVAAGKLTLGGAAGSLASTAYTVNQGAVLALDNTAAPNPNRVPANAGVSLYGGTLQFIGNGSGAVTETVGAITLAGGHSTIQINPVSGFQVTSAQLARLPGATVNVNSTGGTLGTANDKLLFALPPPVVGNGGGILPYATVADNDFATYTVANGVAAFAGYKTSLTGAGANDIVKLTSNAAVGTTLQTIAALVLVNSTVTVGLGDTLALGSGGLILRGNPARIIPGGNQLTTLKFGAEGHVFTNGTGSITTSVAGTAGVDFSGPAANSSLTVNPGTFANSFTGGAYLNSTSLTASGSNPLGAAASPINLVGGKLNAGGVTQGGVITGTLTNPVNLAGAVVTLNGANVTFTGQVTLAGSNVLTVTQQTTLTGKVTGGGSLTELGQGATGILVLNPSFPNNSVANDYTGGTVLASGTLIVGSANNPLGVGPLTLAGSGAATNTTFQSSVPGGVSLSNQVNLNNAASSAAPNVTFGGSSPVTFTGPVTLNGMNAVAASVTNNLPTTFAGPVVGTGGLSQGGSSILALNGSNDSYTGATMVTAGVLAVNGSDGASAAGVGGGTLAGGTLVNSQLGYITAGPGGNVQVGNPGLANGLLGGAGANFSEGGTLTVQVSGYATPGTDFNSLNLGAGTLLVGGDPAGAPSVLRLDLSRLPAQTPGTANGVVLYGGLAGLQAQFEQLTIINNPFDYAASLVYAPTGINVVLTPGINGTPTTKKIWTGAGPDAKWSTPQNWLGGNVPLNNDDLVFPAGAIQFATTDNEPNLVVNSITFEAGGYTVDTSTATVFLLNSLTTNEPPGPNSTVTLNIRLSFLNASNPVTVTTRYAGTTLLLNGNIDTGVQRLIVTGAGTTTINGSVSGGGNVIKDGSGTLNLFGGNSYTGNTQLDAGLTAVNNSGALGSAASAGVLINDGATLQTLGAITLAQPFSIRGFGVGGAAPGSLAGALEVSGSATLSGGITLSGDAWIGSTGAGAAQITNTVVVNGFKLGANADSNGGGITFTQPIIDGPNGSPLGGLYVNPALTTGSVRLTAVSTYTGPTRVFAGSLTLSGNGAITASNDYELDGYVGTNTPNIYPPNASTTAVGTLVLDNTGTNITGRLNANAPLDFHGGMLTFKGKFNVATTDSIGVIQVDSGQSYIHMVPGGGAQQSLILKSAGYAPPAPGATIDFSSNNPTIPATQQPALGTLGKDQILFPPSTPPDLTPAGTIPGATVSPPSGPTLNQPAVANFASYDNVLPLGVVAFNAYQTNPSLAGPTDVVGLFSPLPGGGTNFWEVKQNRTIGGLLLRNGSFVVIDPGVTLTVQFGILTSGGGTPSISTDPNSPGFLSLGTNNNTLGFITAYSPTTISAPISGPNGGIGSFAVTYGGVSPIDLAPPSPGSNYSGFTWVNSGTIALDTANDPFGSQGGSGLIFGGGNLVLPAALGSSVTLNNAVGFSSSTAGAGFLLGSQNQAPINVHFTNEFTQGGSNILAIPQGVTVTQDGLVDGTDLSVVGGGTLVLNDPANSQGGTTLAGPAGSSTTVIPEAPAGSPTLILGSGGALGLGPLTLAGGNTSAPLQVQASAAVTVTAAVNLLSATAALGGPPPDDGTINVSGIVTLTGQSQVATAAATSFTGSFQGLGSFNNVGGTTVTADGNQSGATSTTGGPFDLEGLQPSADLDVTQGSVVGTGTAGYLSVGAGGTVQPGQFGSPFPGTLTTAGANFSNGGTLRLRIDGYTRPGTDFDRLNLSGDELVLGNTSHLVIDLAGLGGPGNFGDANGAILYGERLGNVPVWSQVDVINNPFNYTVRLDYTGNGLNVLVRLGSTDTPVVAVPARQTTPEDIPLTFAPPGNAITVTDFGAINPLQVSLAATHGTLTLGSTAGLSNVSGNGTATVTFQGPAAAVTGAVNGLVFTPSPDFFGTGPAAATLTVSVTNPGGNGLLGGPQKNAPTVAIDVTQTSDSPTFNFNTGTYPLPLVFHDNDPAQTLPSFAVNVQGEPPNTGNLNGLFFTTTNDNTGLFAAQPAVALVGNTGTLTFTPKANADGVANVTVTLSNTFPDDDGDQDSYSLTFQLQVINHNAPAVNDVILHWGKHTASLTSILTNSPARKDVSFQSITAIDLVFNEDVKVTSGTGLSVTGQAALDGLPGGVYGLSAPIYLPNHVVEWKLNTALGGLNGIDKLMLNIAAGTIKGKNNGGLSIGAYSQAFNVLVGDADGNGVVDVNDQLLIVRNLAAKYNGVSFLDLDGDGSISMLDYNIARTRNGHRLP